MGVHPPCKVGQLVDHVSHLKGDPKKNLTDQILFSLYLEPQCSDLYIIRGVLCGVDTKILKIRALGLKI